MSHIAIDARIISSSTGTYVKNLLEYLQQVDSINNYTILVKSKDKDYWKPKNENFNILIANYKNYSFGEQIGLNRLLKKIKPDLVHFCMPQQPIWYKGKHITTFHDLTLLKTYNSDKNWLIFHIKQSIGKYVFKKVINTSEHIITPSEYTKNDILDNYKISPKKISVTYESADVFIDKLEPYDHKFNNFILYVGQQSDYKNIKRLGDAHQKLLEKHPDLGLILVGKKNKSTKINESYFQKNNYKNILFTDFISDEQRDWLYTKAKAYIFPSLMEGFGLPGLEAMGYGTPVISSNATCLPEIYGDAALYFDPLNIDNMVDKIERVISNETLRDNLIEKGYEQINKYSWKKMAEQTHAIYMNILMK